MTKPKLIILDRDGTINCNKPGQWIRGKDDFFFEADAVEAMQTLLKEGIKLAVASNQAGVYRGYTTVDDVMEIQTEIETAVMEVAEGIYLPLEIQFEYACNDDVMRKPSPYMLQKILHDQGVDPEDAVMVGDRVTDMVAAILAGVTPVLVRTGGGVAAEEALSRMGVEIETHDNLSVYVKSVL
jgi:D-glycero-D-manno-heptose 1,7-bisphosphate phosphatase